MKVRKIKLIEPDARHNGSFPLLEEVKRLRAANADLLAACKKALSYISADMPTSDIQFAAMDDVEDALRSAIAKAEGSDGP